MAPSAMCRQQNIAAVKEADHLPWVLDTACGACVRAAELDAELAAALGLPSLFTTAASLMLQASGPGWVGRGGVTFAVH